MQTSWATSKSSAAASFDTNEFESVRDNTVTLASSYNWDQTAQPATSLDPNSDEFFNSMLADDTKVTGSRIVLCRFLIATQVALIRRKGNIIRTVSVLQRQFHYASALGVSHVMRCINVPYLLTYLLTYSIVYHYNGAQW